MRQAWLLLALWLLGTTLWLAVPVHRARAQAAQAYTMQGGAIHTTCLTPATGQYYLCVATDGVWVSNNGAAYFQITPAVTGGITGITVCNLAGASCTPATVTSGQVSLNIPSKVTVTAPTVSVSAPAASSSAPTVSISAPSATATAPTATLQ